MRNSPKPRSKGTNPSISNGWAHLLGALLLTGTLIGSIVFLVPRWDANRAAASAGFVVAGVVLGIVLTDSGMNRSVLGLTAVFMALMAVPFLIPEAVPWDLPDRAVEAAETAGTTTAFYVIVGSLGAATFRPYR